MTPPLHDRVLSTLDADGKRHWIYPKLARGRFLRRRRIVGYALIALFVLLPRIEIGDRPAMLLDLVNRELSLFGMVFRPSDGVLLMLFGLAVVISVFLITALFGRVWCGWGCPQTVYLEHLYRPIERLIQGTPSQQAKLPRFHPRRLIKWVVFAAISFALANVFLAYFVSADRLEEWVFGSPLEHLGGFLVVCATAALMLFDFAWFREQTCIVACPYGRLQSVMLDRQSLIVGYDTRRGEPRTKPKKQLRVLVGEDRRGDCVDCGACVSVCPTGIDIRDGLQMECIGCAQCIDACDAVMDKVGKRRGLIGYTSQAVLAGEARRLLRPRTLIYPAVLVLAAGLLVWGVGSKPNTDVSIERVEGPSFIELPDGTISAAARIKLENESDAVRHYTLAIAEPLGVAVLRSPHKWDVGPRKSLAITLYIDVPRELFVDGKRDVYLKIVETGGFHRVVSVTLLGPVGGAK